MQRFEHRTARTAGRSEPTLLAILADDPDAPTSAPVFGCILRDPREVADGI